MGKKDRKVKTPVILVDVTRTGWGPIISYVNLGHRHLEKGGNAPVRHLGSSLVTYAMPVDLARLVLPDHLVEEIASIELTYRRP